MAESTLSLTYARLIREIGRELSYGHDSSIWTGDKAYMATHVDDCLLAGLARFYAAHDWKFLRPPLELSLWASYSTGTIGVVAGVVTLTGGTFPAAAADGDLIVDGVTYSVASRTSGTALVLTDTSVAIDSGTAYQLVQARATLPDDFAAMIGELHFRPGTTLNSRRVEIVDDERIRWARQIGTAMQEQAIWASIRPKTVSGTTDGQRFELSLWPSTATAGRLVGRYRVNPNAVSSSLTYPYGGMLHGATILEACLAAAERQKEANDGRHEQQYLMLLPQSIRRDAEATAPDRVGFDLGTGPEDSQSVPPDHVIFSRDLTGIDF